MRVTSYKGQPAHSGGGGFSLIELLVVIAVIAILAAILFPVLGAAKARAQRIICMNNLRQINLGVRMYSDESNDVVPSATNTNGFVLYSGYKELMKHYLGLNGPSSPQDRIFFCPADAFFPSFLLTNYPRSSPPYIVRQSLHDQSFFDYSSYSFNGSDNTAHQFGRTNRFWATLPGLTGVKLSSVKHPSRTVLTCELAAYVPGPGTVHSGEMRRFTTIQKTLSALWMDMSIISRFI
jgi:prepilin-type N-terminal cleavage/methylation domain-containing protein